MKKFICIFLFYVSFIFPMTIFDAILKNDINNLKNIVNDGNINEVINIRGDSWTPLTEAVYLNRLEMVKILIEKGADLEIPQLKWNDERTALQLACLVGCDIEIIRVLIEKGAELKEDLIELAIKNHNNEIVDYLINVSFSWDKELKCFEKESKLKDKTIGILKNKGYKFYDNTRDVEEEFRELYDNSKDLKNKKEYFLGEDTYSRYIVPNFNYSYSNIENFNKLKIFISKNEKKLNLQKALEETSETGNFEVVKYLIETFPNLNKNNLLLFSTYSQNSELIAYLADKMDINQEENLLLNIVKGNDSELIKNIIVKNLVLTKEEKEEALFQAILNGNEEIVKMIIKKWGLKVKEKSTNYYKDFSTNVRFIIDIDDLIISPLIESDNLKLLQYLEENGLDLGKYSNEEKTEILYRLIYFKSNEILGYILEKHPDYRNKINNIMFEMANESTEKLLSSINPKKLEIKNKNFSFENREEVASIDIYDSEGKIVKKYSENGFEVIKNTMNEKIVYDVYSTGEENVKYTLLVETLKTEGFMQVKEMDYAYMANSENWLNYCSENYYINKFLKNTIYSISYGWKVYSTEYYYDENLNLVYEFLDGADTLRNYYYYNSKNQLIRKIMEKYREDYFYEGTKFIKKNSYYLKEGIYTEDLSIDEIRNFGLDKYILESVETLDD